MNKKQGIAVLSLSVFFLWQMFPLLSFFLSFKVRSKVETPYPAKGGTKRFLHDEPLLLGHRFSPRTSGSSAYLPAEHALPHSLPHQ
jgi:hypothetical protein